MTSGGFVVAALKAASATSTAFLGRRVLSKAIVSPPNDRVEKYLTRLVRIKA
jgi:hypothetical protein